MNTRRTLILLIAGAAVLFFFLVEQPRHARRVERALDEGFFTDVPAESVFAARIERAQVTIAASIRNGRWELSSPVVDSADEAAVNVLVLAICHAMVERRLVGAGSDLGEYGLDPPAAVVRLAGRGGEPLLEVSVGDFNVTKSHCYAVKDRGGDVFLLGADIRRYAIRPLFEYRNKRIIDVALEDVRRIDLSTPETFMSWQIGGDGAWFTIRAGDTIPGDKTALEGVVRRLRALRAGEIPLGAPGIGYEYLAPRTGTITLWLRGDSTTIETAVGRRSNDSCYVWSSQSGRIARVDAAILEVLAWTMEDVRARNLLKFDRDGLAKISIESPGRIVTIVKSDRGWEFSNPLFGELQEKAVSALLLAIERLRFDAVIDERPPDTDEYGFADAFLRVTLFDRNDLVVDALTVGDFASGGSARYATSRSSRLLSAVSPSSVEAIGRFPGDGARR
jgi:hypothetical protein